MDGDRGRGYVIPIDVAELNLNRERRATVNRPGLVVLRTDGVLDVLRQTAAASIEVVVSAVDSGDSMRLHPKGCSAEGCRAIRTEGHRCQRCRPIIESHRAARRARANGRSTYRRSKRHCLIEACRVC